MIDFRKKQTGKFTVVSMERNLEYLTVGRTYEFNSSGQSVRWFSDQGGSFARVQMLNIFQRQGRLVLEVIQ